MIGLRAVDWAWHRLGLYWVFMRWDWLQLQVHERVCTPVADREARS